MWRCELQRGSRMVLVLFKKPIFIECFCRLLVKESLLSFQFFSSPPLMLDQPCVTQTSWPLLPRQHVSLIQSDSSTQGVIVACHNPRVFLMRMRDAPNIRMTVDIIITSFVCFLFLPSTIWYLLRFQTLFLDIHSCLRFSLLHTFPRFSQNHQSQEFFCLSKI